MTQDLILIGIITLGTIFLTIIRGLYNLPRPESSKEKTAKRIFIFIALAVICLNIFLGIKTYRTQIKAPFKLDRQQLSLSIKLGCNHCSDSDVDSLKSLPSHFTVDNIRLGSIYLSSDFNRIETPVKISGPKAARREIYYRSSYIFFQDKKNSYEYLWDLNGENVSLYLPNEFNDIFDTTKVWKWASWSGSLIIEIDKTSIGEGDLNAKRTFNDKPNFNFKLENLSKEEVQKKWGN